MDNAKGNFKKVQVPTTSGARAPLAEGSPREVSAETGRGGDLLLQGIEPLPPRPIGGVTPSTGTPKSGDGGAVLVDLLFTTADNPTRGREELPEAFRRSSKIQRTPPRVQAPEKGKKTEASAGVARSLSVGSFPNPNPIPTSIPSTPLPQSGLTQRTPTPAGREGNEARKPAKKHGDVQRGNPVGAQVPTASDTRAPLDEATSERKMEEAEEKMNRGIQRMKSLVGEMLAALKRQPNISRVVKDGLPALEEALDDLDESRRVCMEAHRSLVLKRPVRRAPAAQGTPARLVNVEPSTSEGGKRGASSPPLPTAEETRKKRREEPAPNTWTEVVKKGKKAIEGKRKEEEKKRKKRRKKKKKKEGAEGERKATVSTQDKTSTKRVKPEAILLKPASGKTYADVLGTVRRQVKPDSCGVEIKAVRQTRAGEVLLEIKKATAEARAAFSDALKKAVGSTSRVKELVPRASLEIRDLDGCSTGQEVEEAIRGILGNFNGFLKVGMTRPNGRGQRMAIVAVDETAAGRLLQAARVKVGWVFGKIRRRVEVLRCYKCLGYGHQSGSCKGPDRSKLCYRCGTEGHGAKGCEATPRCFLCPDVAGKPEARRHLAGSGECGAFRKALSQAKQGK